jgi:ankyrin repeat protein
MNSKQPTVLTNLQRGNVKQESPILLNQRTPHELAAQGELYNADALQVDVVDSDNMTPLLWASGYGQNLTVELLLRLGANPNHKSSTGKTALMLAANKNYLHVVKTLIRNGANINDTDRTGSTALMYAAYQDYSLVVEELLKNNANLGIVNAFGQSAYSITLIKQNKLSQKSIELHLLTHAGHFDKSRISHRIE